MRQSASPRIAIIGAGMAGITCAYALQQLGCSTVVLEKSRGVGGRLASRRTAAGDHFDHGAQYITAREPAFRQRLDALVQQHSAVTWAPRDPARTTPSSHGWIIGSPGMSALLQPMAAPLELHTRTTVIALHRSAAGWHLHTDSGMTLAPFDAVVCTAPAAQCHALLADVPAMKAALAQVRMAPCWALMLRFAEGYSGKPHGWVLHASPEWSQLHLELPAEDVLALLQQELARLLGTALPPTSHAAAHRWRYALTTLPLGQAFLANDDGSLYAAGDWCLGARVECAHASGEAVAAALATRFQLRERRNAE
jgi:renalase